MERIPNGRYTKEFQEEVVKIGDGWRFVPFGDIKTIIFAEINVRALDKGFQDEEFWRDWQGVTTLMEIKRELAKVKRKLSLAKMERGIIKNRPAAYLIQHVDRGSQYCAREYTA